MSLLVGPRRALLSRRVVAAVGGVGIAPNDASIVASLWAWYDASQEPVVADGTAQATIADFSGSGRGITQGTGAAQALYKTNVANGWPSFLFDGNDNYLGADPNWGSFSFVAALVPVGASGTPFSQYNPTGNQREWEVEYLSSTSVRGTLSSDGTAVTSNSGSFTAGAHVLSGVYNGTDLKLRVNGGAAITTTSAKFNSSSVLAIGSRSGSTQFYNFHLLQVAFYTAALSDANRNGVELWLGNRYGITVA